MHELDEFIRITRIKGQYANANFYVDGRWAGIREIRKNSRN